MSRSTRFVSFASNYVRIIGTAVTKIVKNPKGYCEFFLENYDDNFINQIKIVILKEDFPFIKEDLKENILGKVVLIEGKIYAKVVDQSIDANTQFDNYKMTIRLKNISTLTSDIEYGLSLGERK